MSSNTSSFLVRVGSRSYRRCRSAIGCTLGGGLCRPFLSPATISSTAFTLMSQSSWLAWSPANAIRSAIVVCCGASMSNDPGGYGFLSRTTICLSGSSSSILRMWPSHRSRKDLSHAIRSKVGSTVSSLYVLPVMACKQHALKSSSVAMQAVSSFQTSWQWVSLETTPQPDGCPCVYATRTCHAYDYR